MPTVAADLVALVRAEGVAETQAQLESVGATAEGVGAKSMIGSAGLLGLGAAGLFAADSAFKASETFDTWMRDLASLDPTIAGNTAAYHQMAAAIEQVALNNAQMATDVVKGMYFVASAGYTGKDALEIVNAAARDANAGLTDMASSTKLVTAVLQAYGLGADQAGTVSDKLFAIVRGGVLRYSDLTAQMGDNLSMASSLKVSIDDLGVAYDVLTRHGVSAAETSTQLNALMSALLKPSTEMKNVIHDLGYESGQQMIQQLGLIGTLQTLYNSTDGNNTELAAMFKNIRGLRGELALMTGDTKGVAEAQKNMRDSTGATNEALAQQTQATSYHLREMKAAINEVLIALGDGLRPVVSAVADGIARFATGLLSLPAPLLHVAGLLLGVGSAIATLVGGGALLEELFGGALGVALESTAVAFGELLIPVAAVAGAVYLLYDAFNHNFLGIRDDITNAFNAISAAVETGTSSFQFFTELGFNPVSAGLAGLSAALTSLGADGIATFVNQAGFAFQTAWDGATKLWDGLGKVFDGGVRFSSILKQLPDWMRPVALGLIDLTSGIGKLVNGFTDGGLQGAMAAWPDAWRQISHGIEFATQAIAGWLAQLGRWASVTIPSVVVNIASWTAGKIADLGVWLYEHLRGPGVWLISATINIASWAAGQIADLGVFLFDHFHAAGVWLVSVTANIASWTAGTIADLASWLSGAMQGVSVSLKSIIVNVANWAVGNIADLASWLSGAEQGVSILLKSIMVNVANWTAGVIADVATFLYGVIKDPTVYLVKAYVSIASWSVDLSKSDLGGAMASAIGALKDLGSSIGGAINDTIKSIDWSKVVTTDSFNFGATVGGAVHDSIVKSVELIASADWAAIITDIGNALAAAVPIAAKVFLGVASAMVNALAGFMISEVGGKDAASSFQSFMSSTASAITSGIGPDTFSSVAQAIWNAIWNGMKALASKANPLDLIPGGGGDNSIGKAGAGDSSGGVGGAIGAGGGGSHRGPLFGGLGGGNLDGLDNLGSKLATFFANLKIAAPDLSPVTKAFETTTNAVSEKMGAWVANIGALATGAGRLFNINLYAGLLAGQTSAQGTFNQIGNDAGVFVANLGALATGAGRLFNVNLYAGMLAGQQSAQGVFNAIGNAAGQFVANVAALASFAGSQFNLGLANGLGAAYASALYFMGQIRGVLNLGSEYGVGYGIGSSLGQGLNDGIASWTGAIQATAASAVTLAVLAAKQAGGIASPSREMMYVGDMLGLGAHLGLSNWIAPMGRAGAALTGSAVTGARSNGLTGGYGAGYGGVHIHGNVTVQVNGAQPNSGVVNDIFTALGKARTQQVGLLGANG